MNTTSERTIAELAKQFGAIPLSRIRTDVPPGTATGEDLDRIDREIGPLCELLDGVLVERSGSQFGSVVGGALTCRLGECVAGTKNGWILGGGAYCWLNQNLRAASGSFIRRDQLPHGLNKEGWSDIAPVLVLDVLGPGNTAGEMARKRREFFARGTELFWIVDPLARTIDVYTNPDKPDATLRENDTLTGDPVLPEFTLSVRELFDAADLSDDHPK